LTFMSLQIPISLVFIHIKSLTVAVRRGRDFLLHYCDLRITCMFN